jgi:hypothetical protein
MTFETRNYFRSVLSGHLKRSPVRAATALILLAAVGAAGCADSDGVAASAAHQAASLSRTTLDEGADTLSIPEQQVPDMASKFAGATVVRSIDEALEGLDESRATEVLRAACAREFLNELDPSVDPQDQYRVAAVEDQLSVSYDEEDAYAAWAICEVKEGVSG